MDSLSLVDLVNTDNSKVKKVTEYFDVFKDGAPPYNDQQNTGDAVFSSTLSVLRGIKAAVEEGVKKHIDNSLQTCVLSVGSSQEVDFLQFRKYSQSNRLLLPSLALSLNSEETMYSNVSNLHRYEQVIFDGTRYGLSFIAIPVKFNLSFRYYCRNMDELLRFRDNLKNNAQRAFPREGFSYQMFNNGEYNTPEKPLDDIYVNGSLYLSQNIKEWEMKFANLVDSGGTEQYYLLKVPFTCWANSISKAYRTPIIFSQPKININLK